jgi:tetratricopeptide (TPR) repeat protein
MRNNLLVAGLVTCLAVAALAAQNTLEVKVQDAGGTPLNKVKVQLWGVQQSKADDEKTSKQGVAVFNKLGDDFYRVWVHAEGFEPALHEFVSLKGGSRESVTLTLKPGADRSFYFEDQAVLDQANQLLREGGMALQNRQFEMAENRLKAALAVNPSDPNAKHNLGLLYLQTGRFEEAEKTLTELTGLLDLLVYLDNPSDPRFSRQRADVQELIRNIPLQKLVREADQAMEANNFPQAVAKLEELARMQPDSANVYYTMAVAHVRMNQLDEAETKLDKAIQLDPGQQAFRTLKEQIVKTRQTRAENEAKSKVAGVLELSKAGKHNEAIARAKEVMDEVPDNLKKILWGEMANAYLALDQQDEGMEAYRQMMLLAGDPVDEGFFKLGQEYVKRGKQAQARKAFQKVLEVNPDHAEACYQLGMDYFYEQGDKENAKRLLEKYLKLGKDETNLDNARNVLVVIERS